MAQEVEKGQNLYLPELPYKLLMFPNYQEKKGIVLLMISHAAIDGVSVFSALTAMTKEKDFKQLRSVAAPSFVQQVK